MTLQSKICLHLCKISLRSEREEKQKHLGGFLFYDMRDPDLFVKAMSTSSSSQPTRPSAQPSSSTPNDQTRQRSSGYHKIHLQLQPPLYSSSLHSNFFALGLANHKIFRQCLGMWHRGRGYCNPMI